MVRMAEIGGRNWRRFIPLIRIALALSLMVVLNPTARAAGTLMDPGQDRPAPAPVQFAVKSTTPGSTEYITGNCTGTTDSYEIVCRTISVLVYRKLDPSKLDAELKQTSQDISEWSRSGKIDNFCAGLKLTPQIVEDQKMHLSQSLAKMNTLEQESAKDWISLLEACISKAPRSQLIAQLQGWLTRSKIRDSKTCKLMVMADNPITLRKVAPLKWTGTEGPDKLHCDEFFYYTLESKNGESWRFSYTKNRNRSGVGLFCKDLPDHEMLEFSSHGDNPLSGCDSAEMD